MSSKELSQLQVNSIIELYSNGLYKEALESISRLNKEYSDNPILFNISGACYAALGDLSEAVKNYELAVSINPSYYKAYFNLALVYKDLGNKKSFIKNIETLLTLNPNLGHAYFHLSQVKRFQNDDIQIDEMKRALKIDNLDSIDRIGLNFALAKVYEDLEIPEEQFKFLNEANSLRKKELNYSINKDKKLSDDKLIFLKAISSVIKSGMDIVGVDTPEKM